MPRGRRYLLLRVRVSTPFASRAAATDWPAWASTRRPSTVKVSFGSADIGDDGGIGGIGGGKVLRQGFERPQHVRADDLLAGHTVMLGHSLEQLAVVLERRLQADLRGRVGLPDVALRRESEVHDPLDERVTAGRGVVREVEAPVALVEGLDVVAGRRSLHLLEYGSHLRDPRVRDALGSEPRREPLELDAH